RLDRAGRVLDRLLQDRLRLRRASRLAQDAGQAHARDRPLLGVVHGRPVGGLGRGQVALGLLRVAERARSRRAARGGGLLGEGDRLVAFAFAGASARLGDHRPDAFRVGGGGRFRRGGGGGHTADLLEDGHSAEGLAFCRAGELVRGGLVVVDGGIEFV